jgi:vacuolar-type H+-ATPase subunit F/Vma7
MSQNEEILDCKIEQNQSLLLDNDKFVSKFVPFSIIQDLPDNKNLPLSSTDGQVHHDDTKTFAKDFKNIVSKWVTGESVIHALVTLPADKSDEPDALKDNIKKALKCFSGTDNPQFVALLKKQEEKGLSLRIFAEVFANDTDEQKSKWCQCCKEIWSQTPATEPDQAIKAEVLDLQDIQKQEFVSCPNVTIICKSTGFPSVQPSEKLANQIQQIFHDKVTGGEPKSVLHATLLPSQTDENALEKYIGDALEEFLKEKPSIFLALKCAGENLIHILALLPNEGLWKPEEELNKWPGILKKLEKENTGSAFLSSIKNIPIFVRAFLNKLWHFVCQEIWGKTPAIEPDQARKAKVLGIDDIQKQGFVSCSANINIIDKSTEFPANLSELSGQDLANQIQKTFSDTDGKQKSVLHATLPSKTEDENALKEYIGKALVAFLGKKPSIFLALKSGGENLIHILAAPPNDEKWKQEDELKKWPDILKDQKLLTDTHDVLTWVAALFSSFWSSIKNFLFSTWTVYKNWVFIASVLLNLVTLLGWFGYFVFVRDNTIQISLPDTIPNSVPVWAYDNEGQPCEEGKKLSRDDRRYIIKCGILPAQWSAKTIRISGYQIIELSSLKQDNGHYEVTENDLKPLTEWPVVFSDNPALPFEISTEVQFFDSEPDCKNNPKYLDWRTYQSSVEPLAVNKQPRWAKIRRGDEDLSYCAEGKENFETQDFRITFSFKSNQFEGKRKIVVIAPSVQLASDGIGRIIQDTLKEWLLELKTNQTNVPITILLIGANEEINTLIRSEDLNELPDERENSITAKVNGIAFANESFRSVYELEQVDVALEGKDFDQVLYLTDGKSYSGYSTLSSSLKKALGIPQYWMNNGVSFSVLTVSNCEFWDTEMSDAKCQTLDSQDKKIAQRRFKEMLGKLLPKY